MAAKRVWSDERKNFIQSLLPDKKILFANVRSDKTVYWKEDNNDYDIIIGYSYVNDLYIIYDAKYHRHEKSASCECVSRFFTKRSKINVGEKFRRYGWNKKEPVVIVPSKMIEEFSQRFSEYFSEDKSNDK